MRTNILSFLQITMTLALFVAFLVLVLFVALPTPASAQEVNIDHSNRFFVLFDSPVGNTERGLVRAFGGDIKYSYSVVDAVAAELPKEAIEGLLRNPHVLAIEPDGEVQALDTELDNSWGVKHIEAGSVHTNADSPNKGAGVKIGIIDSGIQYEHPDLNDNYRGGYDFYYYDADPMDVYGHGTHVAATACGEDNNNGSPSPKIGVVGVAPACDLYSLRVLNEDGVGYWSDIVAAIQWATGAEVHLEAWGDTPATTVQGTKLDVVNLSLGKDGYPGQAVEDAFQSAYEQGLLIVAAAGNSGNKGGKNESTIYPAKFPSVIAVAATDNTDTRATFSSTGLDLELAAPGVSVYSAWNDNTPYYGTSLCNGAVADLNGDGYPEGDCYKDGSGTSMASPHVAGTAALVIAAGLTDQNGDGVIDSRDARIVLQNSAVDLGDSGRDVQYGYGLVNAQLAVQGAGTDGNSLPVAEAGPDQTLIDNGGDGVEQVMLDGSASYDLDGSIALYDWYENGVWVASGATSTLTLDLGDHMITLEVTDNEGATDSDTLQISITAESTDSGNDCPPGKAKRGLCTP